jgi:FkbM family methyltransferase
MRAVHDVAAMRTAFRGWPVIAAKGYLWKRFGFPAREITIRSRGGTRISAPLVQNVGALYTALDVFAFGAYENDWELEDEPFIVDIGANIGAWALWVAERRPRLRGTCYEPDPAAVTYLRRNLELNGLEESIEVRAEAVSDQTGTATLFQARPGDGTSSLASTSHITSFERETRVPTVSLSDALERIDGEVSLLKIDCEGAEYDLISRAPASALKRVKRIVLEYHPASPDMLEALRGRLEETGLATVKESRRSADEGTLWLSRGT